MPLSQALLAPTLLRGSKSRRSASSNQTGRGAPALHSHAGAWERENERKVSADRGPSRSHAPASLPLTQPPQPEPLESKASALERAKAEALDSRQSRRGRRLRLNLMAVTRKQGNAVRALRVRSWHRTRSASSCSHAGAWEPEGLNLTALLRDPLREIGLQDLRVRRLRRFPTAGLIGVAVEQLLKRGFPVNLAAAYELFYFH